MKAEFCERGLDAMASALFVSQKLRFNSTQFSQFVECGVEMLEALEIVMLTLNPQILLLSVRFDISSSSYSSFQSMVKDKAWEFHFDIHLPWNVQMGEFRKRQSESNSELMGNDSDPNLKIRAFTTSVCKLDVADATWSTERFLWNFDSNPNRTSFWASKPCACFGHYGSTGRTLKYGWR